MMKGFASLLNAGKELIETGKSSVEEASGRVTKELNAASKHVDAVVRDLDGEKIARDAGKALSDLKKEPVISAFLEGLSGKTAPVRPEQKAEVKTEEPKV